MRVQRFSAVVTAGPRGRGVVVVPFDPDEVWGGRAAHPVGGTIDGRRVRGTLSPGGSEWAFTLSPSWMRDSGLVAGQRVVVELAPEGPQRGDLAEDISAALAANPAAAAFFDTLAQFYRKAYLRWIDATTRRPDLRPVRIAEVVKLLAAGVKERPRALAESEAGRDTVREEGGAAARVVTADLIARARAGDGEAFREVTEPYVRELRVHCYRMLGSFQDAEDALQDTLLNAWQGLGGFEGRASLRTWLYRIATNRCLNARRSASRRQAREWNVPGVQPPEPTQLGEVVWLEPFPDALLEGATGVPLSPEARYEQTESISLAFVTALQVLPPRQLAVLILRDVLGFHAGEVAGMLDSTVESVKSALKRAHASLQRRWPTTGDREPPPAAGSPAEDALVAKFVRAWESADLGALVALLTDDVFMSMPPMPFEYEGRDVVARFCAVLFGAGRRFDLVPARANGQPAFGAYLCAPAGIRHGTGLYVLTLTGDRICALTRFENSVLPSFGLPRSLPGP